MNLPMGYMLDVRLKEERIMILGLLGLINGKKWCHWVFMLTFNLEIIYPEYQDNLSVMNM